MPYVRRHGKQVAIVHGERASATGQVQQRILWTFYSREELRRALGVGDEAIQSSDPVARWPNSDLLTALAARWSELSWDDQALREALRTQLDFLPEHYVYPTEKRLTELDAHADAWVATFEAVAADRGASARAALRRRGESLRWIRDRLDQALALIEREGEAEDPFGWGTRGVPLRMPEEADQRVRALWAVDGPAAVDLATRLARVYDDDPGSASLLAQTLGRFGDPLDTLETWRLAERREVRRWTRPRSLDLAAGGSSDPDLTVFVGLMERLWAAEAGSEAEEVARRWRPMVGASDVVDNHYLYTLARLGRWSEVVTGACRRGVEAPAWSFVAALGEYEGGSRTEAARDWIHAAVRAPRAARVLLGLPTMRPGGPEETLEQEWALELRNRWASFFADPALLSFFRSVQAAPEVVAAIGSRIAQRRQGASLAFMREDAAEIAARGSLAGIPGDSEGARR